MKKFNFRAMSCQKFNPKSLYAELISNNILTTNWGIKGVCGHLDKILSMTISTIKIEGYLFITLNSSNLFDITFTNRKFEIQYTIKDVHYDKLVITIDNKLNGIETVTVGEEVQLNPNMGLLFGL